VETIGRTPEPDSGRAGGDARRSLRRSVPDGINQARGAVAQGELIGRGDQLQLVASDFLIHAPRQVFSREADQIFPFSRLVLR
jgi:hypothetical protein